VEPGQEAMNRLVAQRSAFALAFCLLCLLSSLTACVSPAKTLYPWGEYENSVYGTCRGESTLDINQEIGVLSHEIDMARENKQRVAPGVHAHLGYLQTLSGNTSAAVENFRAEKELYPESAKFIDGLLSRMKT
jgi:hypothetical protein